MSNEIHTSAVNVNLSLGMRAHEAAKGFLMLVPDGVMRLSLESTCLAAELVPVGSVAVVVSFGFSW